MVKISASILACDLGNLEREIKKVEHMVDFIHIDVMDGHFVPNITFGVPILSTVRRITDIPIDVHLMITNPEDFVDIFIEEGADIISVHFETTFHLHRLIHRIKDKGVKAFVALNPHTPPEILSEVVTDIDGVLIMSVNPGFSGQRFIARSIEKIRKVHNMSRDMGVDLEIMVDGGVNEQNAEILIKNGATILVMGYGIFKSENPEWIKNLLMDQKGISDSH